MNVTDVANEIDSQSVRVRLLKVNSGADTGGSGAIVKLEVQ